VIRSIVVCAASALVLAASNNVGRSQSRDGEAAATSLRDRDRAVAKSSTDAAEVVTTYGFRRFGPHYEASRSTPPTDDVGWPADWDKWPHLSVDIFGLTREFNSTREYQNSPSTYGDHQSYARRPSGPHRYGNGPYAPHGYGSGPYAPHGYGNGWYAPNGYGSGSRNRDLFSSESGFALRYGYPGSHSDFGQYPPAFDYPGIGSGYGMYPPPFGYGAHGGQPPYYGYAPPYWGDGWMVEPPGRYGPYFGW